MNSISPSLAALLAVIAVLVYVQAKGFIARQRDRRAALLKAQDDLVKALTGFNASAEKIAASMDAITELPKFMDGFVKVCQAIVGEVGKHRQASDKLAKLILQGQDPKESLQKPTEHDSAKQWEIMQKLAAGKTVEEAVQEVEDEDLKKTMYSPADL